MGWTVSLDIITGSKILISNCFRILLDSCQGNCSLINPINPDVVVNITLMFNVCASYISGAT